MQYKAPDVEAPLTSGIRPPISEGVKERIGIAGFPGKPDYLALSLPFDLVPEYLEVVKNIHGRRWNAVEKIWEIPFTQVTIRFLKKFFPAEIIDFQVNIPENLPERIETPEKKDLYKVEKTTPARYEAAVTALEQVLMLKRYSWRTIKSYKNCFRQFIRQYDDIKPSQITRAQINDYLLMLIKERHFYRQWII